MTDATIMPLEKPEPHRHLTDEEIERLDEEELQAYWEAHRNCWPSPASDTPAADRLAGRELTGEIEKIAASLAAVMPVIELLLESVPATMQRYADALGIYTTNTTPEPCDAYKDATAILQWIELSAKRAGRELTEYAWPEWNVLNIQVRGNIERYSPFVKPMVVAPGGAAY